MKLVRQIIENKASHFNIINEDDTVLEALRVMNRENLSYVIVMDDKKFKGIFCEKDYARKVILHGKHSDDTKVKDIMFKDLHYVDIDDASESCLAIMCNYDVKYVTVLEDYQFRGIITSEDIMKETLSERVNTVPSRNLLCPEN